MSNTPQSDGWATEARKLVPTLVLAGLIGFAGSWWNNQITQNDLRYRVDALEKRVETLSAQVTQNGVTIQQISIKQAEFSIIQNNMVEQIKDMRQERRR